MSGVDGLLLAPGSGGDIGHHLFDAIDSAVGDLPVRRMQFPYRLAGRRAPDRPPVLLAAVRDELAAFCAELGTTPDRVALGGRSLGGRMCSMVAAADQTGAALVLLSYPLHPPGKPDRLRTEHFGDLRLPVLFVSGVRDPFGTPAEFEQHVASIPGPVRRLEVPGGHDPHAREDDAIAAAVVEFLAQA